MRIFSTAGPVIAEKHYHVPPLERLERKGLRSLIDQWKYFVLHAPRQSGKTSALFALVDELNGGGAYRCVYVNVESGQSAGGDVGAAMRAILNETADQAEATLDDVAYQACFEDRAGRDRSRPLTAASVRAASEQLIRRRDIHLDQLTNKLWEERVHRVIAPLLSGGGERAYSAADIEYVRELGLIARDDPLRMANPIYREVIPRDLAWTMQESLTHDPAWYVGAAGELRLTDLLAAFQVFFREHSEHWLGRFQYREAGPQLLLQAFLQRVVNSGGRVEREYGLGRMRTDLLIVWPAGEPAERARRMVIECKVVRGGRDQTIRAGLEQTRAYMDRCAAAEGHLVLFDRSAGKTWSEKVFRRTETAAGSPPVTVWGM